MAKPENTIMRDLPTVQAEKSLPLSRNPFVLREIPILEIAKIYEQRGQKEISISDKEKPYAFVAKSFDQGLLGEDLSRWYGLRAIYKVLGRELPVSFPDRIRLEVFLSALRNVKQGKTEIWEKYNSIGREIDPDWFHKNLSSEEKFLSGFIGIPNNFKTGQDKWGSYREDEDGARWREPKGISEKGEIVYHILLRSGLTDVANGNRGGIEVTETLIGNGVQRPNGNRISHGGRHFTPRM